MRSLLLAALLLLPAAAWAEGPVNPTTVEVDAPTTNEDGSPLTDLKAIGFCAYTSPTGPFVACVEVDAPTPSPTGTVVVSTTIAAFGLTSDGQYYADADAVDLVSRRSAKSARSPFFENRKAPAAPSTPRFK